MSRQSLKMCPLLPAVSRAKKAAFISLWRTIARNLSVEGVVAAVDQQMAEHYRLYQTNRWAWEWLHRSACRMRLYFIRGR
ncbi:MAG: hypothetical protein CM15mP74_25860 [Halieaceae bacterium]|nr:MAG: hypothetical protein CM15mP74_25860 [Halieaceae bacterium]